MGYKETALTDLCEVLPTLEPLITRLPVQFQAPVATRTRELSKSLLGREFIDLPRAAATQLALSASLLTSWILSTLVDDDCLNPIEFGQLRRVILSGGRIVGWKDVDRSLVAAGEAIRMNFPSETRAANRLKNCITIDGPACTGKGQLAESLRWLGFAHIDTGLLYRLVAFRSHAERISAQDDRRLGQCSRQIIAEIMDGRLKLNSFTKRPLRALWIAELATSIARYESVRRPLTSYLRWFVENPPTGFSGVILDGRDTGSEIWPSARVKIFVSADNDMRAAATHQYMSYLAGSAPSTEELQAYISRRDAIDQTRRLAPLTVPVDAHIIDLSEVIRIGLKFDCSLPVDLGRAPDLQHLLRLKSSLLTLQAQQRTQVSRSTQY